MYILPYPHKSHENIGLHINIRNTYETKLCIQQHGGYV